MRVVFEGTQMNIRTRCRTVEQLVGTFKHCVEGNSLFVSTLAIRPVGTEVPFSVGLSDHSIVIRGRGVIRDAWSTTDNRFQRPGILLAIRALTRSSVPVFDQIRARAAGDTPARVERPFDRSPPVAVETTGMFEQPDLDDRTLLGPPQPAPRAPAALPPSQRRSAPTVLPRNGKVTIPPRAMTPRAAIVIPPPVSSNRSDSGTKDTDRSALARANTEHVTPSVALARTMTAPLPAIPRLPHPGAPPANVRSETERTQPWSQPVVQTSPPQAESFRTRCEKKTVIEPLRAVTPVEHVGESYSEPTHVIPSPAGTTPVLPANPLASLTDDALSGYVDCTLFQSGNAPAVTPAIAQDAPAPPRRRRRAVLGCVLAIAIVGGGVAAYRVHSVGTDVSGTPAAAQIPIQVAPGGAPTTLDVQLVPHPESSAENRISIDVVVTPPCRKDCATAKPPRK